MPHTGAKDVKEREVEKTSHDQVWLPSNDQSKSVQELESRFHHHSQWPMVRVIETHQGRDGLVRVVKLRTANGTYTRPVTKVALLLPCE